MKVKRRGKSSLKYFLVTHLDIQSPPIKNILGKNNHPLELSQKKKKACMNYLLGRITVLLFAGR